ncbi:hypothetical protein DB30_06669 [Enhygromyxa salina]|uniref:Pyrrolo-quinoline quinone repeat domain-containing protein n=1 Tax=Enhygromyxa salina TaxID=215803 RepID=A0A0C1ZAG4_9BACT|nr:PQQ-binding-like beta-propeller repeat protein [Enhygromyxa salina]KIG14614.1 hypothetical protein DB30_06669 [Enhygromyxa salina]
MKARAILLPFILLACTDSAAPSSDQGTDTDSEGSGTDEVGTETESESETDSDTGTDTEGTPVCGDGLQAGEELCDDGNDVDLDGCNSDCTPTGAVVWQVDLGVDGFDVAEGTCLATDGATVYFGGTLRNGFSTVGGFLSALNLDGELLWTHTQTAPINDCITTSMGPVVVSYIDEGLALHDSADGTQVWQANMPGAWHPISVADDGDSVVVITVSPAEMYRFGLDGALLDSANFSVPASDSQANVGVGPDGSVYVSGTDDDTGPFFVALDGSFEQQWRIDLPPETVLPIPTHAVGSESTWLSVSREAGNAAVLHEVSFAGEELASHVIDSEVAFDLAIDADHHVLIAQFLSSIVTKRGPDGAVIWTEALEGIPVAVDAVPGDLSVLSLELVDDLCRLTRRYR